MATSTPNISDVKYNEELKCTLTNNKLEINSII